MKIQETKLLTPVYFELQDTRGIIQTSKPLNRKDKHYIRKENNDTTALEFVILSQIKSDLSYNYTFQLTGREIEIELELPFQDVSTTRNENVIDMDGYDHLKVLKSKELKSRGISEAIIENEPIETQNVETQNEPIEEETITIDHSELLKKKKEKIKNEENKQ